MKKLLFTAIAVVGFGMNSWGHTIELKELVLNNDDCYNKSLTIGQQAEAAGYSDEQITWYMNVYVALCMGYTWSDIIKSGYTTEN